MRLHICARYEISTSEPSSIRASARKVYRPSSQLRPRTRVMHACADTRRDACGAKEVHEGSRLRGT